MQARACQILAKCRLDAGENEARVHNDGRRLYGEAPCSIPRRTTCSDSIPGRTTCLRRSKLQYPRKDYLQRSIPRRTTCLRGAPCSIPRRTTCSSSIPGRTTCLERGQAVSPEGLPASGVSPEGLPPVPMRNKKAHLSHNLVQKSFATGSLVDVLGVVCVGSYYNCGGPASDTRACSHMFGLFRLKE